MWRPWPTGGKYKQTIIDDENWSNRAFHLMDNKPKTRSKLSEGI
jgi:hypothetical protein